jgi:hypothetical protein
LGDTVAYEVERLRASVLADLDRAKMEFFQNVSPGAAHPADRVLAPLQNLLAVSADRPENEQLDLLAAVRAADRLHTCTPWWTRCWTSPAPRPAPCTRTGSRSTGRT